MLTMGLHGALSHETQKVISGFTGGFLLRQIPNLCEMDTVLTVRKKKTRRSKVLTVLRCKTANSNVITCLWQQSWHSPSKNYLFSYYTYCFGNSKTSKRVQ